MVGGYNFETALAKMVEGFAAVSEALPRREVPLVVAVALWPANGVAFCSVNNRLIPKMIDTKGRIARDRIARVRRIGDSGGSKIRFTGNLRGYSVGDFKVEKNTRLELHTGAE